MIARKARSAARQAPAAKNRELRLYVPRQSAKRLAARAKLKKLCEQWVRGDLFDTERVDLGL